MCSCIWQQPAAAPRSQRLQRLPVAADDASGCGCSGGAADGPGLRAHMLRGHCGRHVRWQRRGRTNAPCLPLYTICATSQQATRQRCTWYVQRSRSPPHDHGAVHNSTQHAHDAHNYCWNTFKSTKQTPHVCIHCMGTAPGWAASRCRVGGPCECCKLLGHACNNRSPMWRCVVLIRCTCMTSGLPAVESLRLHPAGILPRGLRAAAVGYNLACMAHT